MKKTSQSIDGRGPWYGPEPEIPASAITETIETEILICGAGNAGMAAAIVAGSRGAKTIVIEKDKRMGLIKPYMGAVDTRAQRAVGENARSDKDEIVRELVNYGAWCTENGGVYGPRFRPSKYLGSNRVNEKLVRLWADESGATFDFLADELSV